MLKANIRNALLVALTQAAERHDQSMFNRSTPDLEAEELDRQGDLLVQLGDAIDADPAGIVTLLIQALERVNNAMERRLAREQGRR